MRNLGRLKRLGKLNHFMQDFIKRWHREHGKHASSGCVDISQMPLIREMNSRLTESLSSPEFYRRFDANLKQLETIACEIIDHSGVVVNHPYHRVQHEWVDSDTFARVLTPLSRGQSESEIAPSTAAV